MESILLIVSMSVQTIINLALILVFVFSSKGTSETNNFFIGNAEDYLKLFPVPPEIKLKAIKKLIRERGKAHVESARTVDSNMDI